MNKSDPNVVFDTTSNEAIVAWQTSRYLISQHRTIVGCRLDAMNNFKLKIAAAKWYAQRRKI